MNRLSRRVVVFVIGAATLWAVRWSPAAIFNIADGDVAALKSAIMTANANNADDVIYLATNGTYVLSTIDNYTNGASGLPVITSDNNHSVAIAGNRTTVTRDVNAPAFRIFAMGAQFVTTPSGSVELDSLTITNGIPAIDAQGIKLTVNNCMISGNQDGIYADQAVLTLNNLT